MKNFFLKSIIRKTRKKLKEKLRENIYLKKQKKRKAKKTGKGKCHKNSEMTAEKNHIPQKLKNGKDTFCKVPE